MTINKWTELDGSRARYLSANTPSLEIREDAAKLYTEAWSYDDTLVYAEDHGATDEEIEALDNECSDAWKEFFTFCDAHRFELLTEVSGGVLRCAKTNIPLVDTDDTVESEGDRLLMREKADAA